VVALLFKVSEYLGDWQKRSVTLEPCHWKHQSYSQRLTNAIQIIELGVGLSEDTRYNKWIN